MVVKSGNGKENWYKTRTWVLKENRPVFAIVVMMAASAVGKGCGVTASHRYEVHARKIV